jgi:putative flippase GtrA
MMPAFLTRPGGPARACAGRPWAVRVVGRRSGWPAQLVRFAVVGGAATVVQLALYAFLADSIGSQLANVVSWLASTVVATEAHRRYSFGTAGPGAEADHAVGALTSVLTLLLGTVTLAALANPTGFAGVLALCAVNGAMGLLRFGALRWWMVRRAESTRMPQPAPQSGTDEPAERIDSWVGGPVVSAGT